MELCCNFCLEVDSDDDEDDDNEDEEANPEGDEDCEDCDEDDSEEEVNWNSENIKINIDFLLETVGYRF